MMYNNINYNFTEEEVAAIARLIKIVKNTFPEEKETWVTVAKAFNREAFKEFKKNDKEIS
jgi:hypothetical protein